MKLHALCFPAIGKLVLIILAALGLYLVGNASVSLWDRDEPRYAQTSRQMLDSGDWIVPRLLDQPREKKPVFIYWCQATAMKAFGPNAFAVRFPSAVFVTATLIILASVLWRSVGPRRALWTTFIFGTSGLSIAAAKMSITDGVLVLFITIAQLCLYAILNENATWPVVITSGIAIGFGLLTKGPVVPGVLLTTAMVWWIMAWRDRSRVRLSGPVIFPRAPITTSSLKWVVGIGLAVAVYWCLWGHSIEQRLPNYHIRTIKAEVIDRAATPQEGHKGPPGYYLLTVWGTLFPWSLLLPNAILSAWQNRRLPQVRFALAAIIGPWIMFELIQTKLPHYVLPTFPAIAFLIADMLIRLGRRARQWRLKKQNAEPVGPGPLADKIFLGGVLAWGAAVIIIACVPWLALAYFDRPSFSAWLAMIVLPILSLEYLRGVYILFRAARPLDAAAFMGAGMIILIMLLYGLYLPNARYLQISSRVAQILRDEDAIHTGQAIMIGYKETSLPFYQGGTIRPEDDDHFLEHVPSYEWPKWIVLTADIWKQTPPPIQDKLEILSTIHGLNYSDRLRVIDVVVLRKKPA